MDALPDRFGDTDFQLQRLAPAHRDALADMVRRSAASLGPWLPWCHAGYGEIDAAEFIADSRRRWHRDGPWDFLVEAGGTAAGTVRLRFIAAEERVGNLGYWVDARRQRGGIATRAARLAARLAFDVLAMVRLELVIAEHNVASRGVAEKLGARFECVARNRLLAADGPTAAAIYSLIPGDLAD